MTTGSITKYTAKDGTIRWRVRMDLGLDPATGKRTQGQRTYRTRREAQEGLAAWQQEIAQGTGGRRSKRTVAEVLADWLKLSIAPSHKTTTYDTYEMVVRVHLTPALGAIPVQKLMPHHVQALYANLIAAGGSDHLVRKCRTHLAQALDTAVVDGTIPTNPARRAPVPARRRRTPSDDEDDAEEVRKTWSGEEARAFMAVSDAQSRWGPLWTLMLSTGMRRGEALGLRWRDVNLDRGRLTVIQEVVPARKGGGPPVVSPDTKTPSGRRLLPLSPQIVTALRTRRAVQNEARLLAGDTWQDFGLVFTLPDGRPIPPTLIRYDLARLIPLADVPRLSPHGLRHTYITLSLRAGTPVHVVSKLAGHASVSITLNLYAHVLSDMATEAVDTMSAVLFGEPAEAKNGPF